MSIPFPLLAPPPRPASSTSARSRSPSPYAAASQTPKQNSEPMSPLGDQLGLVESKSPPNGQRQLFPSSQGLNLFSDTHNPSPAPHEGETSFGSFTGASSPKRHETALRDPLGADDLLGSFEDIPTRREPPKELAGVQDLRTQVVERAAQRKDQVLGELDDLLASEQGKHKPTKSVLVDVPQSSTMHVAFDPSVSHHRPHRSPPRRLSQISSFVGPSSPPAVSSAAGDGFVFRAKALPVPRQDSNLINFSDEDDLVSRLPGSAIISDEPRLSRTTTKDSHDILTELEGQQRRSPSPRPVGFNFLHGAGRVGKFPRKGSSSGSGKKSDISPTRHTRSQTTPVYSDEPEDVGYLGDESGSISVQESGRSSLSSNGYAATGGTLRKLGFHLGNKAGSGIKNKWKTVMGPSSFHSTTGVSARDIPAIAGTTVETLERPTPTAMPFEISHETPFASRTMPTPTRMGSFFGPVASLGQQPYIPPSGAPGFDGRDIDKWKRPPGHKLEDPGGKGGGSSFGRDDTWSGTRLVGRNETTHGVLTQTEADALRPYLPARQRLSNKWTLLFSIDQHGAALSTFYNLIELYAIKHPHSGNLLIVRDTHDQRFGVFLNESIKRIDGSYFGSGESWLFKMDPEPKVFKWTGKNDYFALCEADYISFGGG